MRIGLVSRYYPPRNTEGISRQRRVLATALSELGHEVHIITEGLRFRQGRRNDNGVTVHELPIICSTNRYSEDFQDLDGPLTYSQGVYEFLVRLGREGRFDIIDFPLRAAEGFVSLQYHPGPIVVSLQNTSLQTDELEGRQPSPQERALAGLENECLAQAAGLLSDSCSTLAEIERLYGFRRDPKATRIVPHGLPPLPGMNRRKLPGQERSSVEALVIGGLDLRRGTRLLFDVLLRVLRQEPRLRARFVAVDNSANEAFDDLTGVTYPEYFRQRFPDLADRLVFEGYVSDECLCAWCAEADLVVSSLEESNAQTLLQAMRSALPTITFENGVTREIFARGEEDGGIVLPKGDQARLAQAILGLARNRDLRVELGERALTRFLSSFESGRIGRDTAEFYWSICERHRAPKNLCASRVFQVMEALDYGDAVSSITRVNAGLLSELGGERIILSLLADKRVVEKVRWLHDQDLRPDDAIIFHYWNWTRLERFLNKFKGPKAIYYHNITPPECFLPGSACFYETERGYAQLERIADWFDLIIGDSEYNVREYAKFLTRPKPSISIHPVVEAEWLRSAPFDEHLYKQLREPGWVNFLFVGRVARNKRQHLLLQMFDYYYREINRFARLFLLGDLGTNLDYYREIESLRQSLASREHVKFTGKVTDEAVRAYYRAADVFVCASEHEGFCLPLVEAMAFRVPVAAFDTEAVAETLGESGILIHEWDAERIGELVNIILRDSSWRDALLAGQERNLERFTVQQVRLRLKAVMDFLREGKNSPLFSWVGRVGCPRREEVTLERVSATTP